MKRIKVSNNVIRRMPRYLRKLDDLNAAGIERISSGELGRQMGLTPRRSVRISAFLVSSASRVTATTSWHCVAASPRSWA